jgi:hypothetical protein
LHGTRLQSTHGEDLRAGEEHNEEHRERHTKKKENEDRRGVLASGK